MRPAVFLDRDGTIIEDAGYLHDLESMVVFPWAADAIRKLNDAGFAVVVITNQSGVGQGMITEAFVAATHLALLDSLDEGGADIDAFYYCPHHPEATQERYRTPCHCRKPKPGLVIQAAADLDIDLRQSWMVGDRWRDLECGLSAGCRGVLVKTGYGATEAEQPPPPGVRPDVILNNLMEAAEWILSRPSR